MSELVDLIRSTFVACSPKGRSVRSFRITADILPATRETIADEMERLEQEVNNLRAKLAAAEEEIDHLEIVVDSKVEVSRHMEVLKECDEYKAHNALLVGAVREIYKNTSLLSDESRTGVEKEVDRIAGNILESTPSEAYERVQGLIDAVKSIADIKIDAKYDKCNRPLLYGIVVTCRAALQRYRGEGK